MRGFGVTLMSGIRMAGVSLTFTALLAAADAVEAQAEPVRPPPPAGFRAALADPANHDLIRMSRHDFARLLAPIGCTPLQHEHADAAFAAYEQAMDGMAELSVRRSAAALDIDDQQAARDALLRAQAEIGIRRVDRTRLHLETLFARVRSSLDESQQPSWDSALCAWRRANMLNPMSGSGGRHDLTRHADLFTILDTVCAESVELESLLCSVMTPGSAPSDDLITGFLAELEPRLDERITALFWSSLDMMARTWRAAATGDEPRVQALRDRYAREWLELFEFQRHEAEALAALIRDRLGAEAADYWLDAFHAAHFPDLHGEKSADLAHRTLGTLSGITPVQRAVIERIWTAHDVRRRALRVQTCEAHIRALRTSHTSPSAFAIRLLDGDLPPALRRLRDDRRRLNDSTIDRLRATLHADQAAHFQRRFDDAQRTALSAPLEF